MEEISSIVKCMQKNYRGGGGPGGPGAGERASRDITATEISAMFESVDSNNDGALTMEEFVEGIFMFSQFL